MELIHIVGDELSARSNEIRELLNRNGVPYGFHHNTSSMANRLREQHGGELKALPAVFLLDGSVLADPTDAEIMDAIGENPHELSYDVAVVGGGPAGLTSAVYAGSEGLRTLEVRLGAEVVGAEGDELMERLSIRDRASRAVETIPAKMLFVLIGAIPHTDWLAGTVQRDTKGFIVTGHEVDLGAWPVGRTPMSFETSVPGVFAAGDVRLGSMKRVASAVGEGAGAVQNVHQYMEEVLERGGL